MFFLKSYNLYLKYTILCLKFNILFSVTQLTLQYCTGALSIESYLATSYSFPHFFIFYLIPEHPELFWKKWKPSLENLSNFYFSILVSTKNDYSGRLVSYIYYFIYSGLPIWFKYYHTIIKSIFVLGSPY